MEDDFLIEEKHTNWAIFATAVLAFCGVLLETAMNVTFPTLVTQFHTNLNAVQWVTTGYLLAVAATMMITGFVESRMQTKRLVMSGLGLFVLGGIICAISVNLTMLLVGRLIQGLATGLIMPLVFALIMVKIPRAQQGRYVGIAGMLIALAPSLGPSYGGFITQVASWRLSFWLIMPVALIAGVIATVNMPQVFPQQKLAFPIGQFALLLLGLLGIIVGFNQLGASGLNSLSTWGSLLLGILGLLGYAKVASKQAHPLIALSIFHSRQFNLALGLYFAVQFMQLGQTFLLPNYAQLVNHLGSFAAGASLLLGSFASAILSPFTGHWLDRFGIRRVALCGSLFLLTANGLLLIFSQALSTGLIVGGYLLYMIGFSFIFNNALTYGLQNLPNKQTPDGNAAFNTMQQYAGSLGTASVSAVLAATATTTSGTRLVYVGMLLISVLVLIGSFNFNKQAA
jgi:EmrB/QacA subfamily drug resistance transporter